MPRLTVAVAELWTLGGTTRGVNSTIKIEHDYEDPQFTALYCSNPTAFHAALSRNPNNS